MWRAPKLPSVLVFVRHGQSQGNIMSRQERATHELPNHMYPLTELGKEQARNAGEFLRERHGEFDASFTSTFYRAVKTHGEMFPSVTAREDSRLNEMIRGVWHALDDEHIREHFPFARMLKDREGYYHNRAIGGGESGPDAEMRIHSFLEMLAREHAGEKVLCVTHGRWIILFQNVIARHGWEEVERRIAEKGHCPNCSITEYRSVPSDKKGLEEYKLILDRSAC